MPTNAKNTALPLSGLGLALAAALASSLGAQTVLGTGFEPDWSPDGERIAYTRTHGEGRDLHVMRADGQGDRRITTTALPEFFPRWAPEGDRLAHVRGVGPEARLVVTDTEGAGEVVLSSDVAVALVPPTWSPDGGRLMFAGRVTDPGEEGDRPDLDLFEWSLADGAVRRVTDDPADDWDPAWAPDGRTLAFVSTRGGDADLWLADPDGGGARPLVAEAGTDVSPAWSRDGRWIAYAAGRSGTWSLRRVAADGGPSEALVEEAGRVSFPVWSPDGNRLLHVVVGEGRGAEDTLVVREVPGSR